MPCTPTSFHSLADKEVVGIAMQKAITKVAEWSWLHKLNLNASALFNNRSKAAHCQSPMQYSGASFNTALLPNFLRVTIDRALTFGPHVAAVVSKASNRCRVLAALTSKRWSWGKDQLIKV